MRADTFPEPAEPRDDGAGARFIGDAHRVHLHEIVVEREGGGVLEEGLRAEQHGLAERQQALAEFCRGGDPAAAKTRHGVRFRQRGHHDGALGSSASSSKGEAKTVLPKVSVA